MADHLQRAELGNCPTPFTIDSSVSGRIDIEAGRECGLKQQEPPRAGSGPVEPSHGSNEESVNLVNVDGVADEDVGSSVGLELGSGLGSPPADRNSADADHSSGCRSPLIRSGQDESGTPPSRQVLQVLRCVMNAPCKPARVRRLKQENLKSVRRRLIFDGL